MSDKKATEGIEEGVMTRSDYQPRRRSRRTSTWALLAIGGALLLGACGTASAKSHEATPLASGSSAGVKLAKKQMTQAEAEVTKFVPPGPSFNAKLAKGKTVWYVPTEYSIPIFHAIYSQLVDALKPEGVSARVCDGQGIPGDMNQCISEAIAQNAGAIIVDSMPPSIISTEVRAAEAKGIPVIAGNISDPSLEAPIGMKATVAFPYSTLGRLVADSIIVKSNGNANVFLAYTNDTPETTAVVEDGMLAQFKKYCPGCTVHSASLGVADWATGLQSLTASSLAANPSVKYVIAEYDAMSEYMIPAMRSAANSSSLGLYTLNADLTQMSEMAAGGDFLQVDVGSSPAYEGWAFADEALRVMTGQKAVLESIPVRLFNTSNVKSLTLTEAGFSGNSWYGNVNFRAGFTALWAGK